MALNRVVVVGVTGSGKTTLAQRIADILGFPHIELDALHWGPGWTEAAPEEFRHRVRSDLEQPQWVADGNYSIVRDLVWGAADTLVWLDYSYPRVLARLLRRTWRRIWSRQVLWNDNRESLRNTLSRDSLLLWQIRSFPRTRRTYPAAFAEYPLLRVHRFRRPRQLEEWLSRLRADSTLDRPPAGDR